MHRFLPFLGALGMVLSGCQAGLQPSAGMDNYMITAERSAFYKFGPAQAAGPDATLTKNQHVTLIRREFGYSRIRTEDGQLGYVATEDITRAPDPTPTPTPPRGSGKKGRGGRLTQDQPNDIALPQNQPSDNPAPGFRY
jgi:hypothetical protein